MGGGSILLAETKHYKFWLPYSCSTYPNTYRDIRVENKKTKQEINAGDYFREDDKESHSQYLELQKALDELEKENAERANYKAMEKDKIALGDMYARMTRAEKDLKYWEKRGREAEAFIETMGKQFAKTKEKMGRD